MALANDASQQILPGVDGTRGIERFDLLGISVCKVIRLPVIGVPSYLKSGRDQRHQLGTQDRKSLADSVV